MSRSLRALAMFAMLALPLAAQSAPPSAAALHANGRLFNGIQFNDIKWNGVSFNGFSLNGWSLNGIRFNGFTVNGKFLNGTSPNSKLFNGFVFNGFTVNGKFLNGMPFLGAFESNVAMSAGTDWSSLALADVRVRLPLAR